MPDLLPDYRSNNLNIEKWLKHNDVEFERVGAEFKWNVTCPWSEGPAQIEQIADKWPHFVCHKCLDKNIEHLFEQWPGAEKFCPIKVVNKPGTVLAGAPSFKSDYFIRPLGVTVEGGYYYQCGPQGHVVMLRHNGHRKDGFFHLIPDRQFWYNECQQPNDPSKFDWDKAALKYMKLCKDAGYFNPTKIRKSGVWWDNSRVVANLGGHLWVDGVTFPLYDITSDYIYDRGPDIPISGFTTPATDDDLRKILPLAKRFPFVNDYSHVVATGLAIAGLIPNLLDWRPHAWLSGQPGSGKTKTSQLLFSALWVPNGGFAQQTDTTSAGIMERMDNQCVSVIIDDQRIDGGAMSVQRLENIIAMLRGSSSSFEGGVSKGGVKGGKHQTMKSCFVVNSVSYPVSDKQDRERIFNLRCDKSKQNEDWDKFKTEIEAVLNPVFAASVFHRVLSDAQRLVGIIDNFITYIWSAHEEFELTRRYCDQWGTVMGAAWWSQNPSEELTQEKAVEFFRQYFSKEDYEMDVMSENGASIADQCIQSIMSYTPPGEKRTVGEAVWHIFNFQGGTGRDGRSIPKEERDYSHEMFLQRNSIRCEGGRLVIGSGNDRIRAIVAKHGVVNYIGALCGHPEAKRINQLMMFAGTGSNMRVEIPLKSIFGEEVPPVPPVFSQDHIPPHERLAPVMEDLAF